MASSRHAWGLPPRPLRPAFWVAGTCGVLGWIIVATVGLEEGLLVVLGGFLAFGLALWWPRSVAPRSGLALLFAGQALAGCLCFPLTIAGSREPDWTWFSVVALGLLLGAATIPLSLVLVMLLVYPWYLLAGSPKVPYPMLPRPAVPAGQSPTPAPAAAQARRRQIEAGVGRRARGQSIAGQRADQLRRAPTCPPAPQGRDEVGTATASAPLTRTDRVFVALFFLLMPVDAVTLTLALGALPGAPTSALASGAAMTLVQLGMSNPGYAVRSPLLLWISRVALLLMVGALLALVVSGRRRRRGAVGDPDRGSPPHL